MSLLDNPRIFEIWSRFHFKPRFHKLLPYLTGQPRILDVGCASGLLLDYIDLNNYTGIDNYLPYITRASKIHPRATFIFGTFPDAFAGVRNAFDLILFNGIMHHIKSEEKESVLTACHQFLKGNGKVIIVDHEIDEPKNILNRFLLSIDRGRFPESREFYLAALRNKFNVSTIKSFSIGMENYPLWRQLLIIAFKKNHEP